MSKRTRSRRRGSGGVLETGLGLAALGGFLLILPVFMDTPLQQSALEPLKPMGWIMLLVGLAMGGWSLRPLPRHEASETLAWLGGAHARQPSGVTPDKASRCRRKKSRGADDANSPQDQADEAARRAALKAAIKANVAKMPLPADDEEDERSSESESGFADTVLAAPPTRSAAAREDVGAKATSASARGFDELEAVQSDGQDHREAPPTRWNQRVFQLIEWRRFEAVMQALFKQAGFKASLQPRDGQARSDGGVDIWLYSRHAREAVSVVQCKHSLGRPVTETDLKRFLAVMQAEGIKRGTFATSTTFTPEALAFAAGHGIHAMDGEAILALIRQRTPEQQSALLRIALEGEYWRPTCANCGVKLVQRGNAAAGSLYWGCTNHPDCRMRMPVTS